MVVYYELRKVQKVAGGDSLSIVIPKDYAERLRIEGGDYVRVTIDDDKLIVVKASDE